MSPELVALVGVLLGATLTGMASLLLTWRQETREAQAGVRVVVALLSLFERALEPLVDRGVANEAASSGGSGPTWWLPGAFPSSEPWKPYRQALVNRLPAELVERIDAAMAQVELLDRIAALRHDRNNDVHARWWTAVTDLAQHSDPPPRALEVLDQLEESAKEDDWIQLDDDDISLLRGARDDFRAIRQELDGQFSTTTVRNRLLWHWRPLVLAVFTLALAALLALWGLDHETLNERATNVESLLASQIEGESLVACEPVKNKDRRFDCLVTFQRNRRECPRAHSGVTGRLLAADDALAADRRGCGTGDTRIREAVRFLATSGRRQRCTLFAMTQAVPPAPKGRIKREQRRQARRDEVTPPVEKVPGLPTSLAPSKTFIACDD